MTMHGSWSRRDDVDCLCQEKEEYDTHHLWQPRCIDTKIIRLHKNCWKRLISTTRNIKDSTSIIRTTINRKQKLGRKATVWIFQETNKRNLIRANLDMAEKKETESLLIAVQHHKQIMPKQDNRQNVTK